MKDQKINVRTRRKEMKIPLETRNFTILKSLVLFSVGAIGIASILPILPNLVSLTGEELPIPLDALKAVYFVQSGVFLIIAISVGMWLAPKVHLSTPVLDALLDRSLAGRTAKNILGSSLIGGIVGGFLVVSFYNLMMPYLPVNFLENAESFKLPFYARLLYGGITEELLIRWGLMSFLVWALYSLFGREQNQPPSSFYLISITLSALLFGLGHLPVAHLLAGTLTGPLVFYIVFANSIFGLIAGYIFWKYGLEAAMGAHLITHIVILIGEALV